jgi:hypothetical protein
MNPQVGAVAPQPITTNPQGVASITPNAQPVAPQLSQAQAQQPIQAAPSAPNLSAGTSQQLQNIAAYYNIPRQTAAIAGAGQAQGAVAQTNFEAQKAQNEIKIQNQQNMLDPTKYQFTKNADGSVTILNSVGDKVDIGQYAALTGDNPAEALQKAGATDQASQNFIAAYNNLQTYIQDKTAAANGDVQAQAAVNDFYKQNPGLQNLELGQLQTAFMQQYGQYFGQPQGNQNALAQAGQQPAGLQVQGTKQPAAAVNPTLTSQNNPVTSSAYENPNYQTAFQSNPYQSSGVSSVLSQLQSQVGQ